MELNEEWYEKKILSFKDKEKLGQRRSQGSALIDRTHLEKS